MILSTLFEQINSAYRGSDDDVPAAGSPDYTLWKNTTNRKVSEWSGDAKVDWNSQFSPTTINEPGTVATAGTTTLTGTSTNFLDYQVGDKIVVDGETERTIDAITSDTVLTVSVAFTNTVSANTFLHKTIIKSGVQTYNLHRNFINPSDKVIADGANEQKFVIAKAQERGRYLNETYISGLNPQKITFTEDIPANIVGYELIVPGYYAPEDLDDADDVIPVDDPYWLVYAVASELAFNDLTYENKAPALNQKANSLYSGMISSNRLGINNFPRTLQYNVNRIRDTRVYFGGNNEL